MPTRTVYPNAPHSIYAGQWVVFGAVGNIYSAQDREGNPLYDAAFRAPFDMECGKQYEVPEPPLSRMKRNITVVLDDDQTRRLRSIIESTGQEAEDVIRRAVNTVLSQEA